MLNVLKLGDKIIIKIDLNELNHLNEFGFVIVGDLMIDIEIR